MAPEAEETLDPEAGKALVSVINESAQHIGAATLTFLAVCVYIGIAVASTSDEVLLLGRNMALPLFDVQIPLDKFYALAPALLTFLHLHLLLLEYLLVCKVVSFCKRNNAPEKETDLFFPSLPVSILLGRKHPGKHPAMVRFLLWLLLVTITAVLPVGLLIATQVKFLPYHSTPITAWHKFLVLLDLTLIWYFYLWTPKLPSAEIQRPAGVRESPIEDQILVVLARVGGGLLTLFAVSISAFLAGRPGVGYESRFGRFVLSAQPFTENLSVAGHVLVNGEVPEGKEPSADHPRGVQLTGRDLREADFTEAVLINADFRGADLTEAVFEGADLRYAKFSPSKGRAGMLDMLDKDPSPESLARKRALILGSMTRLPGADLRGADLRNTDLVMADMRGVNLEGANLDGADLRLADLRDAHLHGAHLNGANLSRCVLNRADVREAELAGADLSGAYLLGTDFWRSKMYVADLSRSDLRGAKLVDVAAPAATFSGAKAVGADFQNAWLNAAVGIELRGVDLRGAHLGSVDLCPAPGPLEENRKLKASDLRFLDFADLEGGWDPILKDLKKIRENIMGTRSTDALVRFDRLVQERKLVEPPCLLSRRDAGAGELPAELPKELLYYKSPTSKPMEKWPSSGIGEKEYHGELAAMWADEACRDDELAQVLLRELRGESVPRRRLLAVAIARRLKAREKASLSQCPALRLLFDNFGETIQAISEEDPLRTDH